MRNLLSLMVLLSAFPALAAAPKAIPTWNIDPNASTLTFSGKQSKELFQGSFKKFTAEIEFSEAKPEASKIHVVVDMTSAGIDGKDRAEALPTEDWLNVAKFPTAEFSSAIVKKTGEHSYEALGDLTLHGVSKTIALPFTITTKGKVTEADGSVELQRSDFRVGQGRWADDQWVAFPVDVKFHLVATPK